MMKEIYLLLNLILLSLTVLAQPNCSQTSVGLTPINDLGVGSYNGWTGGLYPNGTNYIPPSHKNAGLSLAAQVQPLNASGNPDPINGTIVWLSIGFSNTTMEASVFIPLAVALSNKNPKLTLLDGALGGQSASIISTPSDPSYSTYWATVNSRLSNAGLTTNQVQVIWYKDDNPANNTPIDLHSDSLYAQTKRALHEIKTRFPNVKLCYISSRIYGGYASTTQNPEPYAYRNGWTMKKIIEEQINGAPDLLYSGTGANTPWLSWGVYQWADGTTPRSDGLTWICPDDFNNDGTHPSPAGRLKVANLLLNFFQSDSTACPWFLNNCSISTGIAAPFKNNEINIFPNPFSSTTILETGNYIRCASLVIYNSFGQTVKEVKNISGNTVTLHRDNLPVGLYFVRLTQDNKQIEIKKLIITD